MNAHVQVESYPLEGGDGLTLTLVVPDLALRVAVHSHDLSSEGKQGEVQLEHYRLAPQGDTDDYCYGLRSRVRPLHKALEHLCTVPAFRSWLSGSAEAAGLRAQQEMS